MANQQAAVTVTGFVAGDPVKGGNDNFVVLTFRMGSTRSRFNAATRQWEDYGTAWLTVKAFRALAANTLQSVRRGDRIIVVGVLNTEQWTTEQGELRSRTVIEATNIGHDLTFGTTALAKAQRNGGANNGGNGSNGGNGGAMQQGTAPEQAGPAPGTDPYANAAGTGPVEFGVTEDAAQSNQPQDVGNAVADGAVSPDSNTGQSQQADQQTFTDGFADAFESDEDESQNDQY